MRTGWLKDRVVVITGASRGVGAACAVALAEAGAHLVLAAKTVDAHPTLPGTLQDTAAAVRAAGRQALVVQADVRRDDEATGVIEQAVAAFGRVDALVNNAGAIHLGNIANFPAKRFDLVMGVNARASFILAQAALPWLRRGGGHVLMMSPPLVTSMAAGKAPYLLSKLGMTLFAAALDAEEPAVAACALWPVTLIQTAATEVNGLGHPDVWRTPAILADATVALLDRDPASCSFRAWLDEEVLAAAGVTELGPYACVPGADPPPLSIRLVDPHWERVRE